MEDRRGSTLVQFVLVLPIFILLVLGSYELWRLVAIKQRLEAATIQATRYLMVEGRYLVQSHRPGAFPEEWQNLAREIILNQLRHDSLASEIADAVVVAVDTPTGVEPGCPGDEAYRRPREALERARFWVTASLPLPSPLHIPLLGTADNIVVSETHAAYVECGPTFVPTPIP